MGKVVVIPRGDQVLVEKIQDDVSAGGILLPKKAEPSIVAQKGRVLAMGPGALTDAFKRKPIEALAVGNIVWFNAYPNGVECDLGKDDKGHRQTGWLIRESQIVGVICG